MELEDGETWGSVCDRNKLINWTLDRPFWAGSGSRSVIWPGNPLFLFLTVIRRNTRKPPQYSVSMSASTIMFPKNHEWKGQNVRR